MDKDEQLSQMTELCKRLSSALAKVREDRDEARAVVREYLAWADGPPVVYYRPFEIVERMKAVVAKENQ